MFYCCDIFEEHLRTAASELALESDSLELGNITKPPLAFKPEL